MSDHVLIPLPGFTLPADFPGRIGFIALVDDQLRRLRATGHFLPPRFFGYYFQHGVPMAVGGSWTVSLDSVPPVTMLPSALHRLTQGRFEITSPTRHLPPEFMLVHDRRDGTCWLWSYADGLRFIEAVEPVNENADVPDQKLLGP
jgi:hypothetical protein